MITQFVKDRVAEIETQQEFNAYINRVTLSSAPLEQREAVIEYAKKQYPQFVEVVKSPSDELLKSIEEGAPDVPNMDY